jgi:hypothetical protein
MKRIPLLLVALASVLALPGSVLAAAARTTVSPTNSSLPTISGTARSGETLTGASGTWSGTTPISYAYAWQRCNSSGSGCASIAGATNQNYVASSGDVAATIRVQVTASNSDGSNQALSDPTGSVAAEGTVPASTQQPDPSGKAQDGQTVTVNNGSWSGQKPITFSYQWQSCLTGGACTDIAGATGASYLVGTSQVGTALRAVVTATNSAGKTSTSSNLTAVVTAKSASPVNTSVPVISGSLLVGHTLQTTTGGWTGLGTAGFGYQWTRCNTNGTGCASISGATGQSYGVGQVDLGNALRVNVTATNANGTTSASSSASVIAAIAATHTLTARFGAVLRASQELTRPIGTSSQATGRFTARLSGKTLSWSLTFSHLSSRPTSAGLQKGLRGTVGTAFKTLCRSCYTGSHGTLTLTASQLDAMLRGRAYVNIRTARNPGGEIRGQLNRVS